MGQILVIQGRDPRAVETVFCQALRYFELLYGIQPTDRILCGGSAVAKFPRLLAPDTGIVTDPEAGAWACSAGVPFCDGVAGERALEFLCRELEGPPESLELGLNRIEGTFALVRGKAAGEIVVVTDRLGSLHVYTAATRSCTVICTSSLVLAALIEADWNLSSCREFLATGTVFGERSLFAGIRKLPPATVFSLCDGRLSRRVRYWDLAAVAQRPAEPAIVPAMAAAVEEALEAVSRSFPDPVLDLTGGFDSRILVAAMLRIRRGFSTVVVGNPADPDVRAAHRVAQSAGLPLMQVRPEDASGMWSAAARALPLCDGEYDVLDYGRILKIHESLAARYHASVNGSNGELLKGYWWELLFPFTGRRGHFDSRRIAARRFCFAGEIPGLLAEPCGEELVEHFARLIDQANRRFESLPNTAKLDNVYLTVRMQHWQGRIASATSRLWPCLSPFMWRKPMELALSSHATTRIRRRLSRRVMEHLSPTLAALPLAGGGPALAMRFHRVHRFVPLFTHELTHRLRRCGPSGGAANGIWNIEGVADLLRPNTMLTRDLFNAAVLSRFLAGSTAESFQRVGPLCRILTLELLARSRKELAAGAVQLRKS